MTYPNVRAEMARKGFSSKEVAQRAGLKYDTFIKKLNFKTDFTRSEMFSIRDSMFPDVSIEILFLLSEQSTA